MKGLYKRLAALERRLTHNSGPTLRVTLTNGDTKIMSSASAIDLFKTGEAIKAESAGGRNGMLADLLTSLAETQ